jgi:tight adherence protein C
MLDVIASTPSVRIAVLIGLFALVVIAAWGALNLTMRRLAIRSEIRSISGGTGTVGSGATLTGRNNSAWVKLVDRIELAGLSLADTKGDALRERMLAAGFESPAAPRLYTLLRLILVVGLPSGFVLLSLASGKEMSFFELYVVGTLTAVFGLAIPALYIRAKADRRCDAIINEFPDCLDLMLVCVEAGLGLEAALDRVAREMISSHPLVSQLLATATMRLRAGASREEALRKMADDSRVEEIRSFSTLLIQSDKLGTSVSTTLRVYAAEMRERRKMRAEEKAHRLPVLISIPLVACMLPVMIGTLMLPAAIRVVKDLVPALAGG